MKILLFTYVKILHWNLVSREVAFPVICNLKIIQSLKEDWLHE